MGPQLKKIILISLISIILIAAGYNLLNQKQLTIHASSANLPNSRNKEITIQVFDEKHQPIENATLTYQQTSQAFMYNVGDYWDAPNVKRGTNLYNVYLDWEWRTLEPTDDKYNWELLKDYGLNEAKQAPHSMIRLGVISTSAWIYSTQGTKEDAGYPAWINADNITLVQQEYLEFVEALITKIDFTPDFYIIEVELNALANSADLTNTEAINWLEQLTNKIKETDPNARVALDIAAHDLSPFMEEGRALNQELIKSDMYALRIHEFLNRTDYIDYDIISYHMQPFGWLSQGNATDAINAIEQLSKYNKSIYIPWAAFLAEEPNVPEIENFEYYPVNYSEEWQKNQSLALMNYLISNPLVIGVYWDYYDYVEPDVGGIPNNPVRLKSGFTTGYRTIDNEVIKGQPRLVYEPMKQLWQNLFTNGSIQTNETGIAKFSGFPGTYKIIVSHPEYTKRETTITV